MSELYNQSSHAACSSGMFILVTWFKCSLDLVLLRKVLVIYHHAYLHTHETVHAVFI